ncbi:MAG: DNA primase [Candidatus Colwellbacteria bacterium]|nr:DNA primase [Candidatus Colwellbacteria bacterium]
MLPSEEIKEKLDLVEFLKGYVELRPAGRNYKGLCPFHNEKTPSFIVSPERQIWRCFGCGEGGDIFRFLMRYENLEFYEALGVLAEKAGIDIKRGASADQRQFNTLYEINNAAKDLYRDKLKTSKLAIDYLKGRKLEDKTVSEFEVGFAPQGFDAVTIELINQGYRMEDVVRAGLTVKTEKGRYLDRFRNRIMFPIHNHFGKVVGFSGRIMPGGDSEMAKYINSPETPIFNKSRVLYGFWRSKKAIRQERKTLLVEGQMDFLMLWQRGIENVIATSGTSLTQDHLKSLGRVTNNLVLAFDSDEAGLMAAERVIDMGGARDFNVLVMGLGKYKDPAEAAESDPQFLKEAIAGAKPAMEHYFDYYLKEEALKTAANKKEVIRKVLEKIANLSSGVERVHWLRELSYRVSIPEAELLTETEMLALETEPEEYIAQDNQEKRKLSRSELIAERILHILSNRDDLSECVTSYEQYIPETYLQIYKAIINKQELTGEAMEIMNLVSLYPDYDEALRVGDIRREELEALLGELEYEHLNTIKERLRREILIAERRGELEAVNEKLKEFDDTMHRMQDIRHAKEN